MMRSITTLCFAFLFQLAIGQNAVSNEISDLLNQGKRFQEISPVRFLTNEFDERVFQLEGLQSGTIMDIDQDVIDRLIVGKDDFIQLQLPVSARENLKINLVRHQIFSEDFAVFSSTDPRKPINYITGIHYRGMVENDPESVVAFSVFTNEIMGMITTRHGNMVLGRIQNDRDNRHILYKVSDLDQLQNFECGAVDDGIDYTPDELASHSSGRDVGDCVRVYIEIDDDIVTQKGGVTPATNYITGLFNQSIVLYNNENITMMINEIFAWATPSPYTGNTSSAMLASYQANTGEFNGNISHLVSYKASGGIAVLDGLCATNPDYRKCFSSIDPSYANVPTYSWSVMVITHEMGHVIGSKHTHACAWNGNNTAIDGCAGSTEGSCPIPGIPSEGGTMMSYCHITNAGINFSLGFGPQPGNVIRNKVNAVNNCLTTCGAPPPPPPPSYCASNGNNTNYEWIQKVVLGSINNNSGSNSGYGNFTSLSTNLNAGSTYTIQLTPGYAGSAYLEYWRVWVDYNGDLDWNDSGELIGQGSGNSAVNVSFTVPSGTSSGTKRMRVSMQYNAYPPVCGSFTYGEVEDYSVVIGGGSNPSCSDGIQNQGETGVDCGGPCPSCISCNDGIQNQGETGVDCGGPCPACPTCNDGIQNQGETGVDCGGPCPACPPPPPPPPGSYCASSGSNTNYEWIQKVMLGSINNNSGNNGGYGNYIALSTSLTAGSTYTIQLTPGFANTAYQENWRVWIDYNNDQDWVDAGELVGQGTGKTLVNITFAVPAGTPSGSKRMRVSMQYNTYPPNCGTFTYGEVEDYTVIIGGSSGPSCSDGIQNQGETGVDCGGPCPACTSCNDGIQNQGETGVDCGGPCPACPTCNDGIQNQGETGIDCGGPCPSCPPPPPGGNSVLLASYFETGWDGWLDGGIDATRVNTPYSWEGNYSIMLADNTGSQSAMTSPAFNLSDATGVQIEFYFKTIGVEPGEDFWVMYMSGTGVPWTIIAQFVHTIHFNNNTFYVVTVTVPGFIPTTAGKFRIQCDASDDTDQVYIDQVTITKLTGAALVEELVEIKEIQESMIPSIVVDQDQRHQDIDDLKVYPNPVSDILHISYNGSIQSIRLMSLDGLEHHVSEKALTEKELDIHHLAPGMYLLWIESNGERYPVRFNKI